MINQDLSDHIQIDAVIPWVNGNDKVWQEKINDFSEKKIDFNNKRDSTRYNSIGEIEISIKSILKYATYIKNIFLVTDNQKPKSFNTLKLLAESKGVLLSIVDHNVIFKGFEEYLPTFNSFSIETMLFKVPNLSEHFVIFNDDFFLMRETKASDFFINSYPVIRGHMKKFNEDRIYRKLYHKALVSIGKPVKEKKNSFKRAQQKAAKLAGTDKYVRRFHTPYCVRKSTLIDYFKKNDITDNIKYKFRGQENFPIYSLSDHLDINNNTFHHKKSTQLTYFRSYKNLRHVKLKLFWFLKNKKKLFLTCQSLEMADSEIQKYILNWIDNRLSE